MARPTDQALVSDQAAERLDPPGFDPSRAADLLTRHMRYAILSADAGHIEARNGGVAYALTARGLAKYVPLRRKYRNRFALTDHGLAVRLLLLYDPRFGARCQICSQLAVWEYGPSDGTGAYCDACIPRGCSCNIIDYGGKSRRQHRDSRGRLLPCCEYDFRPDGLPRRDSDGSPKGGDACGSVHDSAAIAK